MNGLGAHDGDDDDIYDDDNDDDEDDNEDDDEDDDDEDDDDEDDVDDNIDVGQYPAKQYSVLLSDPVQLLPPLLGEGQLQ